MTIQISYSKRFDFPLGLRVEVRLTESYFQLSQSDEADVNVGFYLAGPVPDWHSYKRATRIVDITPSPGELLQSLGKTTRYEIARAKERDGIETELMLAPMSDDVLRFVEYYDAFAASKGIPRIRRAQFEAFAEAGKLIISIARNGERGPLAAHAYLFDHARARLTHSASLFRLEDDSKERRLIGRANRLLHWDDILRLRQLGVTSYDMGGWYTKGQDDVLLKINSFKKEFGGTVVDEWDAYRPETARGWLYVRARDLARRIRT
jgi:hypothetical protein